MAEVDQSYLVHPAVSNGELEQAELDVERLPRPVLFMRFVELAFTCGCLATYAQASYKEDNVSKVGLCWATFGSQLIIMVFGLFGYVIGETTPRLTVGQNAVGGVLLTAAGASNLETWWDFQDSMLGIELDAQTEWDVNMLLLTGILALMDAALLFADTLVAAVLWRLSQLPRGWH